MRTLFGSERRVVGGSAFFFFQAEDGIRDLTVTGVQTCALPISRFESVILEVMSALPLREQLLPPVPVLRIGGVGVLFLQRLHVRGLLSIARVDTGGRERGGVGKRGGLGGGRII